MTNQSPPPAPNRIERANTAIIRYPRFKELHRAIRQCQDISRSAGEPQCMSLEGVTGAGKSTLIKAYAQAFPRVDTEWGTSIPIFYMETPSPVTVKGMAASMLEQLGDPFAHRGALWSMNSRLIRLLIACEVELVILDDFHHLVEADTNRILLSVSEWLKVLIKETGVPFLVVGIEGRVEQILKANDQLSRLFAERKVLLPFTWDVNTPDTITEFAQFAQYAERALDMPVVTPWPSGEWLYRLHYATDGVVANIMNLLRYAQLQAMERHSSNVEASDLASAFERRLAKHLQERPNPFVDGATTLTLPPRSASGIPSPDVGGARSQRKSSRTGRISDTSKTR